MAVHFWNDQLRAKVEKVQVNPEAWVDGLERATIDGSIAAMRAFSDFVANSPKARPTDLCSGDFPRLNLTKKTIPYAERNEAEIHLFHLTQHGLPENSARTPYRKWLVDLLVPAMEFCDYVSMNPAFSDQLRDDAREAKPICNHVRERLIEQIK
ncbi:MAG TPA: hypothetical protein VIM46_04895 [Luteolibacter sp.]